VAGRTARGFIVASGAIRHRDVTDFFVASKALIQNIAADYDIDCAAVVIAI
jgi:hypothetical protein